MKVTFKELWTEASQKIDTTVGKNLNLNKKTAEIFKAALTAFALIGIFFARLFGHGTESSVGNNPISSLSSAVISSLQPHPVNEEIQERLARNVSDAKKQQGAEKPKGFEIALGDIRGEYYFQEDGEEWMSQLTSKTHPVEGYNVGSAACQGGRKTMEDAELVAEGIHVTQSGQFPFKLFGIFDGHSKNGLDGLKAAQFVESNFQSYLSKELDLTCSENLSDEGIFKALKECCKKLDVAYTGLGGCTGTVAFIINDTLWVANIGDSRTFIVQQDGTIIQATEDAKPDDPSYKEKIEKLGGKIINKRINNDLAVARSFGDHDLLGVAKEGDTQKQLVSANPKITKFPANFKYLVLACDGAFDVATTNEAGAGINEMDKDEKNPEEMAQGVIDSAIRQKTKDNVSVIVVRNTMV